MLHVVAERSRSIDRCLDLFVLYHLEGFGQGIHAANLSAVLLTDFLISRTDGVRRCLALQIIKRMDVVIVRTSNQNSTVIGIRRRKIIGFSSFRSNVHPVLPESMPANRPSQGPSTILALTPNFFAKF